MYSPPKILANILIIFIKDILMFFMKENGIQVELQYDTDINKL